MRIPRILIIGSSNTDLVIRCNHLPKPGETLLGGEFQRWNGGKGANQAVAAARAGGKVVFLGARGNDDFGKSASAALRREGINVAHFKVYAERPSGVALIMVGGKGGENQIAVASGANDCLSSRDVSKACSKFANVDVVLSQLEVPVEAVLQSARIAVRYKVPFILNPAPAQKLPHELFRLVDTLIPNEHEARVLTGESDLKRAAMKLLKKGCRQIVITLGRKGSLLVNPRGMRYFPSRKIKAINTIGAGDCFCAWFAVGMARKLPIEEIIGQATHAAALSVSFDGVQDSFPRLKDLGIAARGLP